MLRQFLKLSAAVVWVAACGHESSSASSAPSAEPPAATLGDVQSSILNGCQESRRGPVDYVVPRDALTSLSERMIFEDLSIHGGTWLARLAGHPGEPAHLVAVDGSRIGTSEALREALRASARAARVALTLQFGAGVETTIRLHVGEPMRTAEIDQGIQPRADGVVTIRRALVRRILTDVAQTCRLAVFVPRHTDRGRCDGYDVHLTPNNKLGRIAQPADEIIERLGVRDGDLLVDVDGLALCSDTPLPDDLLSRSAFTWTLERGGQKIKLRWELMD